MNIWNSCLDISTNDETVKTDIYTPSAHSLHTNWWYFNDEADITAKVVLSQTQRDTKVILTAQSLEITWDIDFHKIPGFNPQFLSTWNKWIISKFISHICELSGVISLHACAIYSPITWEIKIGIWTSGSWKTAFISSSIEAGWLVIATEMLQVDESGRILPWNTYDVIGQRAITFFQKHPQLNVPVFWDDKIFDQTGSKCLADFSEYRAPSDARFSIEDAEIIFLQFWNYSFKDATPVSDTDMALRFIAHSASEKIESPTYLWNNMVDIPMYGNIWLRNKVIHMMNTKIRTKLILWWNIDDFRNFLS